MAYTPKTWECGETITADDLNHIEQGIAEASSGGGTAPFLVFKLVSEEETTEPCPNNASNNIYITTKTYNYSWQEVYDALNADTPVFYVTEIEGEPVWYLVNAAYVEGNNYCIGVSSDVTPLVFGSPTAKAVVARDTSRCRNVS